jgi:polyphosphate:AMP phosphotransferase
MFESAELGHQIDKETYKQQVPGLREALLDGQSELVRNRDFPVIIVVAGFDGAGKGETVNLLNTWMDPRHMETFALGRPEAGELERPVMWRFWQELPPKGKTGIFIDAWYMPTILDCAYGRINGAELGQAMDRICHFEKMLTDEGALVFKFWLHLSRERQRQRFKKLEKNKDTRWRVTETDWDHYKHYEKIRRAAAHALRQTSTAVAPWTVVEGDDPAYRSLTVGQVLLQGLQRRLQFKPPSPSSPVLPPALPAIDQLHILKTLDLSRALNKSEYGKKLEQYQGRLNLISRHPKFKNLSVVVVFEGSDAAGKGGSIRRITGALDARQYRVSQIAAPTEEELAQPYLWRFWRKLPRKGHFAIFDRSWYGRVLVERVEGLCTEADWMRAYGEINDFEEELVRNKTIVVKFWLAISKEEQLTRFQQRQAVDFKRFKLTDEDWRNRDKWELYEQATCDMIDRTSCVMVPWTLVEANDKRFARIKILQTLCTRLEESLG